MDVTSAASPLPAPGVPQAASCAAPPPLLDAAQAPTGWAPASTVLVPSARRSGMLGAGFDAIRGVQEPGTGQPLTDVQVSVLAPFLAKEYELPVDTVTSDLRQVHLYTGGPAARPWWAVTFGRDIYVPGKQEMDHIMSWEGRRWLSHELGHTMQWRRFDVAGGPDRDLSRTRADVGAYLGAMVLDDHFGPGAVPRGIARWVGDKWHHTPNAKPLGDDIHDTHWLEVEAEAHAQVFARATAAGLPPVTPVPTPTPPTAAAPVAP